MVIIGITGSIGMGKTTIAKILNFCKIPIFDSDEEVKKNTRQQFINHKKN